MADRELGAAAYAIRAARAAETGGAGDDAARSECEWQRAKLPQQILLLVLDDQHRRNKKFWSLFE